MGRLGGGGQEAWTLTAACWGAKPAGSKQSLGRICRLSRDLFFSPAVPFRGLRPCL